MSTSPAHGRWNGARTVPRSGYAAGIRSPRWARRAAYFARQHALSCEDLTTATFAVVALVEHHDRDGVLGKLPEPPVPNLGRGHVPRRACRTTRRSS